MSISSTHKKEIIKHFKQNELDTGSTQVQCGLLTYRINTLTLHLKTYHKDHSARRGLLMLVGLRRRLLRYLKGKDVQSYNLLVEKLGIRKGKV